MYKSFPDMWQSLKIQFACKPRMVAEGERKISSSDIAQGAVYIAGKGDFLVGGSKGGCKITNIFQVERRPVKVNTKPDQTLKGICFKDLPASEPHGDFITGNI